MGQLPKNNADHQFMGQLSGHRLGVDLNFSDKMIKINKLKFSQVIKRIETIEKTISISKS